MWLHLLSFSLPVIWIERRRNQCGGLRNGGVSLRTENSERIYRHGVQQCKPIHPFLQGACFDVYPHPQAVGVDDTDRLPSILDPSQPITGLHVFLKTHCPVCAFNNYANLVTCCRSKSRTLPQGTGGKITISLQRNSSSHGSYHQPRHICRAIPSPVSIPKSISPS